MLLQNRAESADYLPTALLKNLGLAVSGGHSHIFMEQGVRNTLIQGVRSNQDLNKMKDSNNQVNET